MDKALRSLIVDRMQQAAAFSGLQLSVAAGGVRAIGEDQTE